VSYTCLIGANSCWRNLKPMRRHLCQTNITETHCRWIGEGPGWEKSDLSRLQKGDWSKWSTSGRNCEDADCRISKANIYMCWCSKWVCRMVSTGGARFVETNAREVPEYANILNWEAARPGRDWDATWWESDSLVHDTQWWWHRGIRPDEIE